MAKHRIARRWRKSFWRWHRRIGVLCFLFLIMLAFTGILLNHADSWSLFAKPIPAKLAGALYGDSYPVEAYLYDLDEIDVYQIDQSLYLQQVQLDLSCTSDVTGVTFSENYIWIGCSDSLSLYETTGALVEKIRLTGESITALARCQPGICIRRSGDWFAFDQATLSLEELLVGAPVAETLPSGIEFWPDSISHTPAELNFGRLISDFHSGAVAGNIGRILVDLVGFAILFLSISGCYLWLGNKPR